MAKLLVNLDVKSANDQLAAIYASTKSVEVKTAYLAALSALKYEKSEGLIKAALADKEEKVRTTALGLLTDATVTQQNLPDLVKIVFDKGTPKEQQQLLTTMTKLEDAKVQPVLQGLLVLFKDGKLSPNLTLELKEAVDSSGSANLVAMFDSFQKTTTPWPSTPRRWRVAMQEMATAFFSGTRRRNAPAVTNWTATAARSAPT